MTIRHHHRYTHSDAAVGSCAEYYVGTFHLLQRTVCRSESPTLLVCTAPALSGGDLGDSINYTVIMDNAPGPSNTGDLRLSLVPDPSIATDGSALVDQQFRSGAVIQITVYAL